MDNFIYTIFNALLILITFNVNECEEVVKRQEQPAPVKLVAAKAVISPSCVEGSVEQVAGTVFVSQPAGGGPTTFRIMLRGLLPESTHGFHVHRFGDVSQENGGCNGASGHYNPFSNEHGGPKDEERHVGDLGNIKSDLYGNVDLTIKDTKASLVGANSIAGRAFVVHERADDLGKGVDAAQEESKKTGNAGPRIGCGSIIIIGPESLPNAM